MYVRARLHAAVFLSGASLMGLEIVGSRVVAPFFGSSVFVWGALITTFLAALAIGYALGGRLADRRPEALLLARILLLSGLVLWALTARPEPLLTFVAAGPLPERFRPLLASVALFLPPGLLMGVVSPFAVRLFTRDLGVVGGTAGTVSSVSTAGSILGTFAVTFFLIPVLPVRAILFVLGAALVLSGLLLVPLRPAARFALHAAAGLFATGAAALVFFGGGAARYSSASLVTGKILLEKDSAYNHILVFETGTRRYLKFGPKLVQGAVDLRDPARFVYDYAAMLQLSFCFEPKIRSAAILGLGAGVVPSHLSRVRPEAAVTSVEIDPEVVKTAERFFAFRPDANDRVLVMDGRLALKSRVGTVDWIAVDTYAADALPFHMITKEFFALCRERLSPSGVVSINYVGLLTGRKNGLFWASLRSLRSVFPNVYVFSDELTRGAERFDGNTIVVATKSPDRLDRETLLENARTVGPAIGIPDLPRLAGMLYEGELPLSKWPELTDAFSPTDALQNFEVAGWGDAP